MLKKVKSSNYKANILLFATAVVLVVLGYVLMSGGGSEGPDSFNRELFSHQRITLAPILVLTGYVIILFAIWFKPVKND